MPPGPPPQETKHIIILGCGITALSTALALHASQTTRSYVLTIIASHVPGDESINYTSPWAGGHWRSHVGLSDADSEVRIWDQRTYEAWMSMLENWTDKENIGDVGLGVKESRNYWGPKYVGPETEGGDGRGLWWSKRREFETRDEKGKAWLGVEGFEVLDLENEREAKRKRGETRKAKSQTDESSGNEDGDEENVPIDAVFGVKYQSICINVPQYLKFIFRRVNEEGTNVIKANIDTSQGLEFVVKDSKRVLMEHDKSIKKEDIFAVINCTGLGARHFVEAEEAENLFPIRGQTILVKGEAKMTRTYVGFGEDHELAYVVPRPYSGTTILGGCKQVGNWSAEVDEKLSENIVQRIKMWGMADELRTYGKGKERDFEVLSYQVGLRPGRKGGPRVELEKGGRVADCWVVHSYGHSGGGYQCSIGCGERVMQIIEVLK